MTGMLKWLGIGVACLGFTSFAIFGFLAVVSYEAPIEAPWLLSPERKPGRVTTEKLAQGEYWFEVDGLGSNTGCTLVARRADGRLVFRETSQNVTGSGCRGLGTASSNETWTLEFTAGTPGAVIKAYQSHGDGFPHIRAILRASLLACAVGLVMAVFGYIRKARSGKIGARSV